MDGFIPTVSGGGSVSIVNHTRKTTIVSDPNWSANFTPTLGNVLLVLMFQRNGGEVAAPAGWTLLHYQGPASATANTASVAAYAKVSDGTETTFDYNYPNATARDAVIIEINGPALVDPQVNGNSGTTTSITTGSVTPTAGLAAIIIGASAAYFDEIMGQSHVPGAGWTELYDSAGTSSPFETVIYKIEASTSGSYNPATTINNLAFAHGWHALTVALLGIDPGGLSWIPAPDTTDVDDGTSDDVTSAAAALADDAFWRGDYGSVATIGTLDAVLGFEDAGAVTVYVQGGDAADWSDAATVVQVDLTATGGFTADELHITWDGSEHRYWRLVLDAPQGVEVFEVGLGEVAEHVPQEPARAILEIYVHDEDASRWGTATWATGAATGTEGIWSAAGWQDVTPQGVTAHIIWGSREPDKGILARQNAASWNVETYDPDRILDPGNADSPYYPQIVAGTPIRISHDTTIIRTGLIDRIGYKYKAPDYRGQLLCTDTISLLNQAKVPEDSILGDTLITRVQDAIEAAGVAVGGIPLPPSGAGFTYPAIAPLDTDNPRERSVWDHITAACEEVLFVPFIGNTAGLGLRNWGFPLDRGREITAANLEDLESVSHEDGLYSVVRVQGDDPLVAPIEREAAPLPRYGRRVYERTELTVDPEGFADAVLQERSWPGVRYSPGTIHCWTAEDVDYFGSLQIMERVTVTVPGTVSVEGRILGGELWVQHFQGSDDGATWQFTFAVATEGSTAIGLTTLVSSQAGDTLLDSQTETDYLEAD